MYMYYVQSMTSVQYKLYSRGVLFIMIRYQIKYSYITCDKSGSHWDVPINVHTYMWYTIHTAAGLA